VKLSAHDAPIAAFPAFSDSDTINLVGLTLVADCAGALFWPTEGVLAVADLHLEKGSSLAARGVLLPPYDTATTLSRLGRLVASYSPRLVVAVGDSFHDPQGPTRISPRDRAALKALQRGREWVWIAGNHDPDPAEDIGGIFTDAFSLGPLTFRHDPTARYQTEWTLELGYDDSTAFCATLPEQVGVAAIPMSAFCDPAAPHADVWNHLVRFTFCKRDDTLDEAISRLAALRGP